ncbi:MAG TPA: hypothetical protein VFX16_23475 [Pseudonocardiaceae bacterium]|nr:hypothetical protein [Pseudonocardiaceae bacterium]
MSLQPPRERSWIAAVHASEHDHSPLGTAVVLDQQRLVTSAHVTQLQGHPRDGLWVAFPFAGAEAMLTRIAVRQVRSAPAAVADLAVLELEAPVLPGVVGARLRRPPPDRLEGLRWWAFGFPDGDWKGNDADGTIGRALGYGWVRLDTGSRFVVKHGFSGGGLWCPDYDAVIAVVGHADQDGNGQAVTVNYADRFLPEEKILLLTRWTVQASGDTAQQAWNWTLTRDAEADRHWRPRARGVMSAAESGHRFRGRTTALRQIISWMDQPSPDRAILAVTGSPGAGKSAVLGRIVVTADHEFRDTDPEPDPGTGEGVGPRATVGSVACAVHVKGKNALDVACEIARAASTPIPRQARDLPALVADELADQPGRRFMLVVDALDEASDPVQARLIVREVLLPLAADRARTGVRILLGTRRFDGAGDLLGVFGAVPALLDLDDPTYFAVEDLAAYAQATLQLRGAERPHNPYQADDVAAPVARRIAELAEKNFLIAALVARTHGLYDQYPVAVDEIRFTPTVQDALDTFLRHLPSVEGVAAVDVLACLAPIEAPGIPIELWQTAVTAVTGRTPTLDGLREFAHTSAANFLVESARHTEPVYRLFHQALNDTLKHHQTPVSDNIEATVTRAFLAHGHEHGWDRAPAYLRRSLPDHAARSGVIDQLLTDVGYTLQADLRRLIPAAAAATTPAGREALALLRRTPAAVDAEPDTRLAMFSVTEALDQCDTGYRQHPDPAPYRAVWAHVRPRTERAILSGHTGPVHGVCAVRVDGRDLLVSASRDQTVRIWDPATGTQLHQLTGHTDSVNGACAVRIDGRDLLASASEDDTVRIWDPATGTPLHQLTGDTSAVNGVCAVRVDGRDLLASASWDDTVRIWDPATGTQLHQLTGHTNWVTGVCPIRVDGRDLLATASQDQTVRIWDPTTGTQLHQLTGHTAAVTGVCLVEINGRNLLASASEDQTVRIWDPATGIPMHQLAGHTNWVTGVCPIRVDGRDLLASASDDATVRIWDPTTATQLDQLTGQTRPVHGVCAVRVNGRDLLASASDDATVRIWDPTTGTPLHQLIGHTNWVTGLCPVKVDGRDLLASASKDQTVRIWDPTTGSEIVRIPVYAEALTVIAVYSRFVIGLSTGLLALHISDSVNRIT